MKKIRQHLLSTASYALTLYLSIGIGLVQASESPKASKADVGFSKQQITPEHGNAVSKYYTLDDKGRKALANHNEAVQIFDGIFLRDPYIMQGPDGYFYYTGTRLDKILGGGKFDYLNEGVEIWRSPNLADWELLGVPVRCKDLPWVEALKAKLDGKKHNDGKPLLWAPELHYFDGKWYITHTSNAQQAVTWVADDVMGPYKETMPEMKMGHRHDPTFFKDDDGRNYLLYRATDIIEINKDFSGFGDRGQARGLCSGPAA